MIKPLISVIIPAYNAAQYLERCVDSVCRQTYAELDIILIDDGSTDGTGALCDRLRERDKRVRVIHQRNAGSGAARNAGLDAAYGQLVAMVDADDFVHPSFLQRLYDLMERFDTEIAMCRNDTVQDSVIPAQVAEGQEQDGVLDFAAYCALLYTVRETEMVALWNKLYKRAVWNGVRFPAGRAIDDAYVIWKLVYKAGGIAVTTTPLYYYFVSAQSAMRGEGKHLRAVDGLDAMEERLVFLEDNGYAFLAYRTEFCILLCILEIYVSLGGEACERELKHALSARYRTHARALRKRPEASWKTKLKLTAFQLYKPLFRRTSRSEQLF